MEHGVDRRQLEQAVRSKLAAYGIDAKNFFIDWDARTIVVICGHITGRMKIFMSDGSMSLGTLVRDSMVSAHKLTVGKEKLGLIVVYCKGCLESGLRMMLGSE